MQRTIKLQDISSEEARENYRQAIFYHAQAKHVTLTEQLATLHGLRVFKREMLQKKLAAVDFVRTIFSLSVTTNLDKINLATELDITAKLCQHMTLPAVSSAHYEASETVFILKMAKDYLMLDIGRKVKRQFFEEHARLNKQNSAQSVIDAYEHDAIRLCQLTITHENFDSIANEYMRQLVSYKFCSTIGANHSSIFANCIQSIDFNREEILQTIANLQYRLAMNPNSRHHVDDFIEQILAYVLTLALKDSHFLREFINAAEPKIAKLRLAGLIKLHMEEHEQFLMIGRKALLRLFTAKYSAISIKTVQQRLRQQVIQSGLEHYIANLEYLTTEQLSSAIVLSQMDVSILDRKTYFHFKNLFPLSTNGIEAFKYCSGYMIRNFPDLLSCIATIESRSILCMALRGAIVKHNMIEYLQRVQDLNLGQYLALARLCMMNVEEALTDREAVELGLIFRTPIPEKYTCLNLRDILTLMKTQAIKDIATTKMQELIHDKLLCRCVDYHLAEDHLNQLCTYLDYPNQPDTLRLLFCDGNVILHPFDEILPGRIIEMLPDQLLEGIDLSSSKEYVKDKLLYKPVISPQRSYLYSRHSIRANLEDCLHTYEESIPKRKITLC